MIRCLVFAIVACLLTSTALAFAPIAMPPPVVQQQHATTTMATLPSSPSLTLGIHQYLTAADSSTLATSPMLLSLQERKPPTPEEIAAKKFNFNLWFWGGGIVAPFLATVYYFGFKFWEK
jgi:hypothetical protein